MKNFLKENRMELLIGGIVGAIFYFVSNQISPDEFSVLQSSLSTDKIASTLNTIGVSLNLQQLLFFVIGGVVVALIVSKFIVKFK